MLVAVRLVPLPTRAFVNLAAAHQCGEQRGRIVPFRDLSGYGKRGGEFVSDARCRLLRGKQGVSRSRSRTAFACVGRCATRIRDSALADDDQ